MGDHPEADTEEVEGRAHPLWVAPGQVVVDRDDVHATTGHRVEDRGHRGHERLAFAGLHFRDPALVKDGRADELDVEGAHPDGPSHRLADHREDLRGDVVEARLDPRVLLLAPLLGDLATPLEVGVVELVFRGLVRDRELANLLADLGEPRADLLLGKGLDLGLEGVCLVDKGLDASKLTVVGVDETGKQSHGR